MCSLLIIVVGNHHADLVQHDLPTFEKLDLTGTKGAGDMAQHDEYFAFCIHSLRMPDCRINGTRTKN
jgi:hypothetical protein